MVWSCVTSRIIRGATRTQVGINLVLWSAGAAANIGMIFKCMTWAKLQDIFKVMKSPRYLLIQFLISGLGK